MEATELTREYEGSTIPAAGTYTFDPAHTHVGFNVRHMMVAKVRGYFAAPAGTFTVAEDPTQSSVEVELDWSTVETGDPKRDANLRSPDFFNVEKFPTITFKSTSIQRVHGKLQVTGDLTLTGITKPVTLDVEGPTAPQKGMQGGQVIGLSATGVIHRSDFNFGSKFAPPMLGDDVQITIDLEADQK
jgi:polyisoprenoid-binding protein YceI